MSDETDAVIEPDGQPDPTPTPGARRRWPWIIVAAAAGFMLGLVVNGSDPGADGGQAAPQDNVSAGHDDRASGAEQPAEETEAGTPEPDSASNTAGPNEHEHGQAPSGWHQAAEGFGRTFTNTSLGQQAWFDAVSSWMTPAQAAKYEQVPVSSIPTGELVDTQVSDPGGALYTGARLTYDTGLVLEVGLTYDADTSGWLIASVKPAEQSP